MQIEIYADVIFLINLLMDFFVLWVTAKIHGEKTVWLRLAAGAVAAALFYCVALFLLPSYAASNFLTGVALLLAAVFIGFNPRSVRKLIQLTVTAYVAAFAIGGLGTALYYMTDFSYVATLIQATAKRFSVVTLAGAVVFSYIVLKLALYQIHRVLLGGQKCYPLKIQFNEQNISLHGLVDTGHTLCDPLTNAPIVITEFMSIQPLLPERVVRLFEEQKEDDLPSLLASIEGTKFAGRLRMIPFQSLGKKNGLLIGFKADQIEISNTKTNLTIDNAVVGIYNFRLTKNSAYQALLNPCMCKFDS